jgi:hypothetical protein
MLVALADYRDQGTEVADTSVEENQTEPSRPEASATESQKPSVTPNQPNPQPAAPPTRNDPTKLVIAQSSKRSPLNLGGKQVKTASVDFKPKVGEPLHTNIPWYSRIFSDAYPWTVVPVKRRDEYVTALEAASVEQNIRPFTEFIGDLLQNTQPQKTT